IPTSGITEHNVQLRFTQEEAGAAEESAEGLSGISGGMGPSTFIGEGLDIEDQQLKIKAMAIARKTDRTAAQETTIVEMRTRLSHSLARFRLMQARYMPPVLPFLSHRVVPDEEDIESVPLLLPSSLNSANRQLCGLSLGKIEYQLREAQCHRFLNELRNLLFIKSRLVGYKDRNARHQGANTRT
ncbi:hypothetical protein BDN71DRAFT_1539382, partial [Pleurotus eryngii]